MNDEKTEMEQPSVDMSASTDANAASNPVEELDDQLSALEKELETAKQDVLFGGTLLFVFSFGVGTLLLIVGASAGLLAGLPKSGAWMVTVKKLSGIILLAAGAYFLYSALIS